MDKYNKPPSYADGIGMSIWTFRVTPSPHQDLTLIELRIQKFIHAVTVCNLHLIEPYFRFMLFKEKSKYQRVHYHARIVTAMKKSSLYRIRKMVLPGLKGNGMFSFHPVYYNNELKDENFIKSITYVAKDGNCIFTNYKDDEIKLFIEKGKSFKKRTSKGKISNIINTYEIKDFTKEAIVDYYVKYHKDNNLNLPCLFMAKKHIEQIELMTSKKAKRRYIAILKYNFYKDEDVYVDSSDSE